MLPHHHLSALRGRFVVAGLAVAGFWLSGPPARAADFPGNPPITPRWAFEPWVWEDTTNTQASTTKLVADYKAQNIPVGAVIVDSPWSPAYMSFAFDPARYPDAAGMISNFRAQKVQVVCWMVGMIDQSGAGVPQTKHPNFDFARSSGYVLTNPAGGSDLFTWWKGVGLAIDFTSPAAVNWFMGNGNASLISMGVRGFKVDESNAYLSDPVRTSAGSVFGGASIPKSQHTAYYHARIVDWIRAQTAATDTDGLTIARPYSWQGQPAGFHCPVSKLTAGWCGDFAGDFAGFQTQISNIYSSVNAGYSAVGFEVGGYFSTNPTRDSLLRQAEFASLLPIMENGGSNGGLTYHLPWYWDSHGFSNTATIYRYYATLHRNLAPFEFHLGVEASLTGQTAVSQTDGATYRHVLGNVFLTRAVMAGNNTSVVVKFPAASLWIDWWNQANLYTGGGQAAFVSAIDKAPIFVRAGSIVPVNVDTSVTGLGDAASAGKDTVLVYPYNGSTLAYHRALGDGISYEDVTIQATEGAGGSLQVSSPTSRPWLFKVKCFAAPSSVSGADSWSYDGTAKTLTVQKTGANFVISVAGLVGYSSITPIATTIVPVTNGSDTWTGGASTAAWSVAGNWSGANTPPAPGDALIFSGSSQTTTINDLASATSYTGISFSAGAGAFTLTGDSLTVAGDIVNNSTANETLSLNLISDAGASRKFTATATTGKLIFNGAITRTNASQSGRGLDLAQGSTTASGAATYEFAGAVTLANPAPAAADGSTSGVSQRNATIVNLNSGANVTLTGGYWSVGQNNSVNVAVQPAILNVNGGAQLNLSATTNFTIGHNFNAGANNGPNSGVLNVNAGGAVSAALGSGGDGTSFVRLGLNVSTTAAAATTGAIKLAGGALVTSRAFVRGGSLANTGIAHTQQTANFTFDGGTLVTDGLNDAADWFPSTASGAGSQNLPLNSVALNSGGAVFDTAGRNATISFGMSGSGGLTKIGAGTLTLSGNNTYTGPTAVNAGRLKVTGSLSGVSSLTVAPGATLDLPAGTVSVAGAITNGGTFRQSGGGTLSSTGVFTNNGVLDLINGSQALPANFVNNGIVLDSSAVKAANILVADGNLTVSIQSYAGHTYQLQRSLSLMSPAWQNLGPGQSGTGGVLTFIDAGAATGGSRFYRIVVNPE